MNDLSPSDVRHLDAAKGWCGLHDFSSATAELARIAPHLHAHPDVLEIRWQICMNLEQFERAMDVAGRLFKARPERWSSWAYLASSFVETGHVQQAYAVLQKACRHFSEREGLHYDLACVCCSLQKLREAKRALAKAIELGGEEIRLKGLEDPDLKPVREKLGDIEME